MMPLHITIDAALEAEPQLADQDIAVAVMLASGWSPTDAGRGAKNWRRMVGMIAEKVRERRQS
jgi:cytochrome P450